MQKILIPVDGSQHAERAAASLIKQHQAGGALDIHLLNVQIPIESGHARMFVSKGDLDAYYRDEGRQALQGAAKQLQQAGIPFTEHLAIGHVAETIVNFAQQHQFDQIVMGTHGRTGLTGLLLGSVASDVLRSSKVPVTLVK
ncbi:MAG: universal stress protein [Burkholderiales bacterium RIFCSPLOWO2_02_FULL_57_36]|nr:MAG: universal stress protein [Burkholderiales bacterium RIFCSPLOWO2_02_FULL_57_36]